MKKSSNVTLGLLAAVAMIATSGCSRRTEVRDCVDENKRIVEDWRCGQGRPTGYAGAWPYYWMYGGRAGGHLGDTVVGGSTSPTAGAHSVSRGGFGTHAGSGIS